MTPRDILERVGPAADTLESPTNRLQPLSPASSTTVAATLTTSPSQIPQQRGLEQLQERRGLLPLRTTSPSPHTCGQINFDGKLLEDLEGGFEKVNRLAVVAMMMGTSFSASPKQRTLLGGWSPLHCRTHPESGIPVPLWKYFCTSGYSLLHPEVLL